MNAAQNLDGVRGKVFRVDMARKSFEFLTETVLDPQTDEGRTRHTVYWSDTTRFTKVVRHSSFENIAGPVAAEFHSIGDWHLDAIERGEPFRCKFVNIFPELPEHPGVYRDRRCLVGWLTPDPESETHRAATIEFNGKTLAAALPGPHGQVDVYSAAKAEMLADGFWQASIRGEYVDNRFVCSSLRIYPEPDPRVSDDPSLPRVLVVGDSISMNYHEAVKAALAGIANYYRVEGNGGPSDRGVACMELWLGDYTQPGLQWDLIQFNHGLHDLKQFYDEDTKTYGAHQVDLASYKANLEKEIAIMRKTGATLMWCSTTPVPSSSVGHWGGQAMGRQTDEDLVFNKAALEVLANHPDILVNDLNGAIREALKTTTLFDDWRKGTDVHFWHRPQQEFVGKVVAQAITNALERSDRKNTEQ